MGTETERDRWQPSWRMTQRRRQGHKPEREKDEGEVHRGRERGAHGKTDLYKPLLSLQEVMATTMIMALARTE